MHEALETIHTYNNPSPCGMLGLFLCGPSVILCIQNSPKAQKRQAQLLLYAVGPEPRDRLVPVRPAHQRKHRLCAASASTSQEEARRERFGGSQGSFALHSKRWRAQKYRVET